MDKLEFNYKIHDIRCRRGMTQKEFALMLTKRGFEVQWENISKWERGESAPSICGKKKGNIYNLAKALNCNPKDLV